MRCYKIDSVVQMVQMVEGSAFELSQQAEQCQIWVTRPEDVEIQKLVQETFEMHVGRLVDSSRPAVHLVMR